ncbi:dihydrodipicolinate synthase family protein [Pseudolysinimonas kribbensis]|uniref:dihydrodipicolinate synthase family protein n=1 Tax=Pseudolysinimonas kribbensis TaxID=433641 RepID=UPI0031CF070A
MTGSGSRSAASEALARGTVIPAHPLAITEDKALDERRQRALTRYYIDAGAGGVAVGVHTTQFAIRDPRFGLYEPVLRCAADTVAEFSPGDAFVKIAGVSGAIDQAVAEAEVAADLGYDAVLLSPNATTSLSEEDLVRRTRAVGGVLPVIAFYLQPAVGGRRFSEEYWTRTADIESVVAVKLAPFSRYRTLEAVRGIVRSGRGADVALYTGNDDTIVNDLVTDFHVGAAGETRRFVGGLLGQWAVGTRAAVELFATIRSASTGDDEALRRAIARGSDVTDANSALFDTAHDFAGSIAGINEHLRRQGLLAGNWCLEEAEVLSPGQAEELSRVRSAYPWLTDDAFVAENLDRWLG